MRDETARVGQLSGGQAKLDLERSKRADGTGDDSVDAPGEARQVDPGKPGKAQREQPSRCHENDEQQVHDNHDIGEQRERHAAIVARCQPIAVTCPPVSVARDCVGSSQTVRGVPAAAHTVSYCSRSRSTSVVNARA